MNSNARDHLFLPMKNIKKFKHASFVNLIYILQWAFSTQVLLCKSFSSESLYFSVIRILGKKLHALQ